MSEIKDEKQLITYKEIQKKDVINVVDGMKLGKVIDLCLEAKCGEILTFTVKPSKHFINVFHRKKCVVLKWDCIMKIGDDVIIVKYSERP